jgi:hypothetical protein
LTTTRSIQDQPAGSAGGRSGRSRACPTADPPDDLRAQARIVRESIDTVAAHHFDGRAGLRSAVDQHVAGVFDELFARMAAAGPA